MLDASSRKVLHVSRNAHMSVRSRKNATASTSSDGKTHNGDGFRREWLNNLNFWRMLFLLKAIMILFLEDS